MNRFRKLARPLIHVFLVAFSAMSIYVPFTQAAVIGTEQALNQQLNQQQRDDTRHQFNQLLERQNVTEQLAMLGVDKDELQARVDNMSDQELAIMADRMDQLPAGQGVVGLLVFFFLVFLVTDILGYTDIFPFVKKHH